MSLLKDMQHFQDRKPGKRPCASAEGCAAFPEQETGKTPVNTQKNEVMPDIDLLRRALAIDDAQRLEACEDLYKICRCRGQWFSGDCLRLSGVVASP